ncbi:hypothetical protein GIW60_31475, partial [Pseudomonas gessardii]|nr:hypothetical protein [Pseudomonas gessardii]
MFNLLLKTFSHFLFRISFSLQNKIRQPLPTWAPKRRKLMGSSGNPETWAVGERDTVIDALDRAVARHPDKILLDFSG